MPEKAKSIKARSIKATTIVVAIVFTVSLSGFFIGMRQTVRETGQDVEYTEIHPEETHHSVQTAVDYKDIAQAGFGPNSQFKSQLSKLRRSPGSEAYPHPLFATETELRAKRESRRAYDGAPPIVPHPIAQDNAASCLQCHKQATMIGDVIAPGISHPEYTSCTQCHVSSQGLGSRWNTAKFDLHTGNRFAGDYEKKAGLQAYPDAPQTIPHRIHMRQNCISCHGELGTSPIRTPHPERQSCTQCHVPGNSVDQRNFAESPFPFTEALLPKKSD
jgi:cytochrome c-type protein NapB